MLLRDLLDHSGVSLPLLTGEHDLDRPLHSTYTTDLLDPGRYLTGGEMVLTGLMWRRTPSDSEQFVASLAKAGIAALGAGEGLLGPIPDDLVEACKRHHVPLFAVPADISFREVTDRVTTLLWSEREAESLAARSRHRGLMSTLAAGADLSEIWPFTGGSAVVEAWALSSTGRVLAGGAAVDGARLAAAYLAADRLPTVCRVDGREFHLDGLPGPRLGGRFVACTSPDELDELVSLVALDQARQERAQQLERRLAARLIEALDSEKVPGEFLQACGLGSDDQHVVLVASLAPSVLEDLVYPARSAVAETSAGSVAIVRVDDAGAFRASVRSTVQVLATVTQVTIGISRPTTDALPTALVEARHAHTYASERPGRLRVASCDELASQDLLLAGVPASARRAFAHRLLEPLITYDEAHNSELLRTLEAFLACDGSWTRCASLMHLHVNTLRYRIRRIAALTGRDLDSFTDRVDFHLALRLRP